MKNTIIWGFDHPAISGTISLLEQKGIIRVIEWVGSRNLCNLCTIDIQEFFDGNFQRSSFLAYNHDIYNNVYQSLYKFMDMFSRRNFPYNEKSLHEFLNIFNIFFIYFFHLLKETRTDMVLFANLPHEGPDLILYEVAKNLHLKTILCSQSIFTNKFFYINDIDDFGNFESMIIEGEKKYLKLEKRFEKELFYMKSIYRRPKISLLGSVYKVYTKAKTRTWQSRKLSHFLMQRGNEYIRRSEYAKNEKIFNEEIDLKSKYVYFPLHLQPELTTSTLGSIFADQLLAIERLAEIIPEDWHIYVKENPKQTAFMRGQWFFDRLCSITKVKKVTREYDTYFLIKHSMFVATITGTAGWEAISGGKNVLIFGKAWYKHLPGVFSFDENLELEDVLNYKIDHDELEEKLNLLLSFSGDGIVDPAYFAIARDNFTKEKNFEDTALLLEKFIRV